MKSEEKLEEIEEENVPVNVKKFVYYSKLKEFRYDK